MLLAYKALWFTLSWTWYFLILSASMAGYSHRKRDSMARIHSMTIEAPITQVINIINDIQGVSGLNVAQSLDKVVYYSSVCVCVCVGLLRAHYTPLQRYMGYLCTRKAQYAPPRRKMHHGAQGRLCFLKNSHVAWVRMSVRLSVCLSDLSRLNRFSPKCPLFKWTGLICG